MPNLFHLIGLCLGAFWLEVQDFLHPALPENVMTPFHSLVKTESQQETSQIREANISVGGTT
jgi:hypothetical protein